MSGNEDEEADEPRGPGEAAPYDPEEEFPIDIAPEEEPEPEELPEEERPPEGLGRGVEIDIDEPDIPFALDEFLVQTDGEFRIEVDFDGKRRTVELRDPRPFEDELIDELVEDKTDKYRRGANIPVKGLWIHGWLQDNGEDYIANIFRNYQFFLKYVQGVTKQMNNRATVNRAPGTYKSMYNYLLILEYLDLVERFRREEIPEDEFDHPVPDEFQDRTFLRVTTPFSEAEEQWRNPYKAQYPHLFDEEEREEEPPEEEEATQELPEPEEGEEEPPEEEEVEDVELDPEEVDTVTDLANPGALTGLVTDLYDGALRDTLDDPPAPRASEGLEPDQFTTGRMGVYGVWAEGNATPGEDDLRILVEIEDIDAPRSPGFIPIGVAARTQRTLNMDNPAPQLFPSYDIDAVYTGGFMEAIRERVDDNQEDDIYYELTEEEYIEL